MTQVAYSTTYVKTQKSNENYEFLEHSFPELFRIGQEADKYYATDHSCCLLKARLFVELWCYEASVLLHFKAPIFGDLIDIILNISNSGRIPVYIEQSLNNIRIESNKSVHIKQCSDGRWSTDTSISHVRLKRLMEDMFELAQYIAVQLNHQPRMNNDWHEPVLSEVAEHIDASLRGNKEASFTLAQRASRLLDESLKSQDHRDKTGAVAKKDHIIILKEDLRYWLSKAERQGHKETNLMYAKVYMKKQLVVPIKETIDDYFKKALKDDSSGEVAYEFGKYLIARSQYKRGLGFIKQAGEKSYHSAIRFLQETYYNNEQDEYEFWVGAGVDALEKRSFTLDLEIKIGKLDKNKNNDLLKKKARTALIIAEARQSDGVLFYKGYCEYSGYWLKEPDMNNGIKKMMSAHITVPSFLDYEYRLFSLIKTEIDYIDDALSISGRALFLCKNKQDKAQLKFDIAMLAREKLYISKEVSTSYPLINLLKESAKEGCKDAFEFISSKSGKVFMQDMSLRITQVKHAGVNRVKQKKAKKLAKKSRCK